LPPATNIETALVESVTQTQQQSPLYRDFGNLFERLGQCLPNATLMTPDEYLNIDNELATCDLMTDEEIVQTVTGEGQAQDSDDNDNEATSTDEERRVTSAEATAAIDTVMRYFEQLELATADDITPLSLIRRRIDRLRMVSQKQTSILDFFHK
jgi:hypothetical protein